MQRLNVKNIIKFLNEGEGKIPTQAELNQIDVQSNTSLWFKIAVEAAPKYPGGFSIKDYFSKLFALGLWPSSEALSACDKKVQHNAWSYLVTYWPDVFKTLLDKNILPTAKDLSDSHGVFSVWVDVLRRPALSVLLDNNIFPRYQDIYLHWPNIDGPHEYYNMYRLIAQDILPRWRNHLPLDLEKKLKPVLSKSEYKHLCSRRKNLLTLEVDNMPNNDHMLIRLLSRHDVNDFYGAIYLLYVMQTKRAPRAWSNFPVEILLMIYRYVLPQSVNRDNIGELFSETCKFAFVKYHAIRSFGAYFHKWGVFSHSNRALSLLFRLKKCEDQKQIRGLLDRQYLMSRNPGKTNYKNLDPDFPLAKFCMPYAKKVTEDVFDQDFKHLLTEVNITSRLNRKR